MNKHKNFTKLLIAVFLLSAVMTYGQKKITVTMNDGTVLSGVGKIIASGLKYKPNENGKYRTIKGSEFDYAKVEYKKMTVNYAFRPIKKGKKPMLMTVLYQGQGIALYNWKIGNAPTQGLEVNKVFAMRTGEEFATMLRSASLLGKSFEERAVDYFSNCPSLVSKLGTEGYTKKDYMEVAKYYEDNCGNGN